MANIPTGMFRKGVAKFASNTVSSPVNLIFRPKNLFGAQGTIRNDLKTINAFSRGSKDIQGMAQASGRLLGTAAGLTYVSRAIRGKDPFKKASGKRDILPWVPFV